MPVNFDLNDLYAFRALVEYGNFRVAAESICLSQSALSRRIEKLEAALGNRLFDRTTRRVALTLYGQNFAERSAQLLDSVESMLADVDKASEERTGLIAVAAVPSAACYFMPDVIRRFQSRYPRVRIKLIDSSAGNVIDAVARSQADFGICFAGNLPSEIEFFPLVEDVYVAACRKDHPVAQKAPSPGLNAATASLAHPQALYCTGLGADRRLRSSVAGRDAPVPSDIGSVSPETAFARLQADLPSQ